MNFDFGKDISKMSDAEKKDEAKKVMEMIKTLKDATDKAAEENAGDYANHIYNQLRDVKDIKTIDFKPVNKDGEYFVVLILEALNKESEVIKSEFDIISFETFEMADYISSAIARLGIKTEFKDLIVHDVTK